jgi:glutathione S-transferase
MATLEILGRAASNYVRSCRMLCNEKGIEHTLTVAGARSPELNAIHPYGLMPCLRHGSVMLFESKAIMSYIDRVMPGPKFMPEDPVEMALTEQWIAFANHKVDRCMIREYVVPHYFADKEKGPDRVRMQAALPDIDRQAAVLDRAVAATGYLVGGRLTMADINLLPMVYYTRTLPEGKAIIAAQPNLTAYVDRLSALPSFVATAPQRP